MEVIAPETLVISEEFGCWDDSRRRIDLLAVDKDANLVVIELKRTEDGGHMDLQAIRYAAMVSTMTFDRAVDVFEQYLNSLGREDDASALLLEFLEWDEADEDRFAQEVRIVLASAEFSKEITTSVLWLNEHGLDIRCIRLRPYQDGDKLLLDVQQVIPLPEAEEYQVRIRDKVRLERVARTQSRDFTKYDVVAGEDTYTRLPKRRAIYHVIRHLCASGATPEDVGAAVPWKRNMIRVVPGEHSSKEFEKLLAEQLLSEGNKPGTRRYFVEPEELIYANGNTYAVTKMWGRRTAEAIELLLSNFPEYRITCSEASS